jgi:hypothetical protein
MFGITKEKTKLPEDNCLANLEHSLDDPTDEASEALMQVNLIREGLGWEPIANLPKGKIGDPTDCPVYHALNGVAEVNGDGLIFDTNKVSEENVQRILALFREYGLTYRLGPVKSREDNNGESPIGQFVKSMDWGEQPKYIQ